MLHHDMQFNILQKPGLFSFIILDHFRLKSFAWHCVVAHNGLGDPMKMTFIHHVHCTCVVLSPRPPTPKYTAFFFTIFYKILADISKYKPHLKQGNLGHKEYAIWGITLNIYGLSLEPREFILNAKYLHCFSVQLCFSLKMTNACRIFIRGMVH